MVKFFSFSKKQKISADTTAQLFVNTLIEVVENGFEVLQDFVNTSDILPTNPKLNATDIKWFRWIVFAGNIKMLYQTFEEDEAEKLHNMLIDKMIITTNLPNDTTLQQINDYVYYISNLVKKSEDIVEAMARAIIEKYDMFPNNTNTQNNHHQAIFLQELQGIMSHFLWNWEDYLAKHRITF